MSIVIIIGVEGDKVKMKVKNTKPMVSEITRSIALLELLKTKQLELFARFNKNKDD